MSYDDGETWNGGFRARPRAVVPSTTKAFWQKQIDRATEKLEVLEQFGDDDYAEHAVIRFDYQFAAGGKAYSYVCIKCEGLWYSSGPKAPKGYTWDEMCAWWAQATNEVEIWYVTEYAAH